MKRQIQDPGVIFLHADTLPKTPETLTIFNPNFTVSRCLFPAGVHPFHPSPCGALPGAGAELCGLGPWPRAPGQRGADGRELGPELLGQCAGAHGAAAVEAAECHTSGWAAWE